MKSIFHSLSVAIALIHTSLVRSLVISTDVTMERRAANTCADPTLAEEYFEGFSPSTTAHVLQRTSAFVATDTQGGDWQIQKSTFQGWASPQEFTFPLYAMYNPTTIDYLYILSTNGETPVANGFQALGPVVWAYSTQICGSVPLFALAEETVGDHWYTTLASERDDFTALGWIDSGITAYVLPLSS